MVDVYKIIRDITGIKKQFPRKSLHAKDWLSWYRGKVLGFHNYRIYNGTNYLELERKTLHMPKFVCETWANLLMNERCDIIIPEEQKIKLDNILNDCNFWQKANDGVEKSFALGLGALVMNVVGLEQGEETGNIKKEKAKIKIDFINETKMFPITVEDRDITECAFVTVGSEKTYVTIHMLNENGIYEIHNYILDSDRKVEKKYIFNTKSEIPWFFVLRPNISSNFVTELIDDEIGISIFANSLDTFRAIDNKYDGFDLEYVLGRKRMFISTEAWTVNKEDGTTQRTFDPYDQLFYHLPENDEGKPLITNKADDLRFDAYIKGINAELQFLSMKCQLGESFFKFDGTSIATATQVISENSTLFRNIKKHEILLENVLINLTKVIIKASNDFTTTTFNDIKPEEIKIQFDDSIIEDKEAEMKRDREDVVAGIMSIPEYREKWYGEDAETAEKSYRDKFLFTIIDNYLQALTTGAIRPEEYVEKVFPDATNKEEIIEYINSFVNSSDNIEDFIYGGNEENKQQEQEKEEEVIE